MLHGSRSHAAAGVTIETPKIREARNIRANKRVMIILLLEPRKDVILRVRAEASLTRTDEALESEKRVER